MTFIAGYNEEVEARAKDGVPALPLDTKKTAQVVELLKSGEEDQEFLLNLLENRVPPGVDDAAYVKAAFLNDVSKGNVACGIISPVKAIEILGTMLGGYNVQPLVDGLSNSDTAIAQTSANALKNIVLVYDAFNEVETLAKTNSFAKEVLVSWANAEWFTSKAPIADKITVAVLKVPGETNTDDLSPASEAFTRSDIPLHANSMLVKRLPGSIEKIKEMQAAGHEVAYVGDVVGTGSSRKSGINSVQWFMGRDIPFVPNKKTGCVVLGSTIAPIFFNTAEDSGALPIEVNVDALETGDVIDVYPFEGKIEKDGKVIVEFDLTPNTLPDENRAGGRIPLIIGRGLTSKARASLGMPAEEIFAKPDQPADTGKGYTQAQKMVGKACGLEGVRPGMYIEPQTSTVGSQDTTGPMTRDEIKELAALGFNADLVMQSFCHTAAYPKPTDVKLHHELPEFIQNRSGVALRAGDGVIHSWINRMVMPDEVGTGADSHTRFPIGISFPAGSGLVAFAGVTGSMPLNMPESVLVRFKGELNPGITLRDLVNAIPYYAIKQGHLTVPKKNKKNIFAGTVVEIEGLPQLNVEQAFELSDATAERSSAACSVQLDKEPVIDYLKSNVTLLEAMVKEGYGDPVTIQRRADKMKEWIKNPELVKADKNAEYKAIIEIDLADVTEPILCCPNDPDDVATLSEILADDTRPHNIDEVFVGSCMTNIGHYRALGEVLRGEGQVPTKLWIAPPTKMDKTQLVSEGYYNVFGTAGARVEIPGCSLCMGNQARVSDNSIVFSTSTRNFDNRIGMNAKVYLGSAELAALCSLLGRLPTKEEYMNTVPKKLEGKEKEVYKYLEFNLVENYELVD